MSLNPGLQGFPTVSDIVYAALTPEQIGSAMSLKEAAGWNQLEDDWQLLLSLSSCGSYVAVSDQRVVGSVTLISYERVGGGRIGWVGMLLVHPEYRRRGIGAALFERAIRDGAQYSLLGLDATPSGAPLYERFGFRGVNGITRWTREPGLDVTSRATEASDVSPVRATGPMVADCVSVDTEASGWQRREMISSFVSRAPMASWFQKTHSRPPACVTGRPGSHAFQIGPLVAEESDQTEALLGRVVSSNTTRFVIDIPDACEDTRRLVSDLGFTETRGFTRMYLVRSDTAPRLSSAIQAIAGPEFG